MRVRLLVPKAHSGGAQMVRYFARLLGRTPLRAAGITCAPLLGLRRYSLCDAVDDTEEMKAFMSTAKIPERFQPDFARVNAGTVKALMTYDSCRLNADPPNPASLHTLLAAAATGSQLQPPDDIPTQDHADDERKAEFCGAVPTCKAARWPRWSLAGQWQTRLQTRLG